MKQPKRDDYAKVVAKGYWNQWVCKEPVDGLPMIEYDVEKGKFMCVSTNAPSEGRIVVLQLEKDMFGDLYAYSRPEFESMLKDDTLEHFWEDAVDLIESEMEEMVEEEE